MTPRWRVLSFGSAAALVVEGSICGAVVNGTTGDAVAIASITIGLGAVVLLLFLEMGLSEERELARETAFRAKRERRGPSERTPARPSAG